MTAVVVRHFAKYYVNGGHNTNRFPLLNTHQLERYKIIVV